MIDERARPLLDLIALHESERAAAGQGVRDGYDVVSGFIVRPERPVLPLSSMTVAEVLRWQKGVVERGAKSSAAGRYQIIRKTLEGLRLDPARLFSHETQDEAGFSLLMRRGWEDFIAGILTPEAYANSLAKEWASLPVVTGPKKGLSYYDGDGLNKASCKPAEILKCLNAIQKPKKESPVKYVGYEKAWAAAQNMPAGLALFILVWWGVASAGLLESAPLEEAVLAAIAVICSLIWAAIKVYATPSPTYNRELGQRPVLPEAVPQPERINWPLRRTG